MAHHLHMLSVNSNSPHEWAKDMYMRFVRSTLKAAIFFGICFGLRFAKADMVLLQSEPAGQVTALEAAKAAQKGEQVFACEKKYFGENGRQRKVKGSKVTFNVKPGKHDESAGDALLDGKQIYSCKTKTWNKSEGKFESAD